MDEDDPRNRRLTVWRGSDWKAADVSPALFPDSPQPNFPTPQARCDYERAFAEREFRERLKTAGNWGFVRVQGLDTMLRNASLAAHQLSTVAASFLDQSLRAYGNLLLDRELLPEEALRQFDEKAAELAEESFRDKWCSELAAMGIEESSQHIHFDRVTALIGEVRRDLAVILWEIAIEKPFADAQPGDEPVTSPATDKSGCIADLVEPGRFIEEEVEAAAPRTKAAGRRATQPTPEQVAAAEKLVEERPDVPTQVAANWLPCSVQHMRRLARNGKVAASNTSPMRITTDSLRDYNWRRAEGIKVREP
jgi:hypothetical protein